MPTPPTAIQESVPASDRVHNTRTVYDATAAEIFWRNFIAGAGRAVGGILIYGLFLLLMGYFVSVYILPSFTPLLSNLTDSLGMLKTMQQQQQQVAPYLYGTPGTPAAGAISPSSSSLPQDLPSTGELQQLYELYLRSQPSANP